MGYSHFVSTPCTPMRTPNPIPDQRIELRKTCWLFHINILIWDLFPSVEFTTNCTLKLSEESVSIDRNAGISAFDGVFKGFFEFVTQMVNNFFDLYFGHDAFLLVDMVVVNINRQLSILTSFYHSISCCTG